MPAELDLQFEELELPFDVVDGGDADHGDDAVAAVEVPAGPVCPTASPLGIYDCCPLCGGELRPEHAHYRCACGWRDSCCD